MWKYFQLINWPPQHQLAHLQWMNLYPISPVSWVSLAPPHESHQPHSLDNLYAQCVKEQAGRDAGVITMQTCENQSSENRQTFQFVQLRQLFNGITSAVQSNKYMYMLKLYTKRLLIVSHGCHRHCIHGNCKDWHYFVVMWYAVL